MCLFLYVNTSPQLHTHSFRNAVFFLNMKMFQDPDVPQLLLRT